MFILGYAGDKWIFNYYKSRWIKCVRFSLVRLRRRINFKPGILTLFWVIIYFLTMVQNIYFIDSDYNSVVRIYINTVSVPDNSLVVAETQSEFYGMMLVSLFSFTDHSLLWVQCRILYWNIFQHLNHISISVNNFVLIYMLSTVFLKSLNRMQVTKSSNLEILEQNFVEQFNKRFIFFLTSFPDCWDVDSFR